MGHPKLSDIKPGTKLRRLRDLPPHAFSGDICIVERGFDGYHHFVLICDQTGRTFTSYTWHLSCFELVQQTPFEEVAEWAAKVEAAKEKIHGTHTDQK